MEEISPQQQKPGKWKSLKRGMRVTAGSLLVVAGGILAMAGIVALVVAPLAIGPFPLAIGMQLFGIGMATLQGFDWLAAIKKISQQSKVSGASGEPPQKPGAVVGLAPVGPAFDVAATPVIEIPSSPVLPETAFPKRGKLNP